MARTIGAWENTRRNSAGYVPKDFFDTDVKAAGAEMAVAKGLGKYWDGSVGRYKKEADIGKDIEVRMTSMRTPKLIIRPNDSSHPERKYVLVNDMCQVGQKFRYELMGWMQCSHAMQEKFLTDNGNGRPPAWFVPVGELRPMEDI
ncbi:MAG: hypothetical protein HOG43_01970 [Flavobacteriales bacterium]|nr:hypothetical protein [Flavobacteriales bacterium]